MKTSPAKGVAALVGLVLVVVGLGVLAVRSKSMGGPAPNQEPPSQQGSKRTKPRPAESDSGQQEREPRRTKARTSSFTKLEAPKGEACSLRIHPAVPIADLAKGFGSTNYRARLVKVLERRYPPAAEIVQLLPDPTLFDRWFAGGKDEWSQAMIELGTAVHESAHLAELALRRGRTHVLLLDKAKRWTFPIVPSFDRSKIKPYLPDDLKAMSYAATYLEGKSGAQGFEMLLEELHAYEHSLAVAIAVADQFPPNLQQSARDGLLNMMYYVERYLRLAREQHPAVYRRLGNKPIGDVIGHLFDRAVCLLRMSAKHAHLGIEDELLYRYLFGDRALGEVRRLRQQQRVP